MQPSAAVTRTQGSSDDGPEETEGRNMKCLANNTLFSDCGGTKKNNRNLRLFTASLSKRVNLSSEADVQVCIIIHIPSGGNRIMEAGV